MKKLEKLLQYRIKFALKDKRLYNWLIATDI
jgi:hypothetical protein